MEIDITDFVKRADPCEFSASQLEFGEDTGKITWNNAKQEAADSPLLPENATDEFKRWVREFGAWDQEEIDAWDTAERNALLIQYISGDLRELESLCYSDDDDEYNIDWQKAEELSQEGTIGSNIFKGADGRVYFYMGN